MQKPELVLVHGASHGAWSWFKVRAILENRGYKTTVIDLLSSGRDQTDANSITSVEEYARPLTDYLARVSEKVIIVGHSLGGVSISYSMEKFPEKISKAVYVAAILQGNNESAVQTFPPGAVQNLIQQQVFLLPPNTQTTPTSFKLTEDFGLASKYMYNQCADEDVYLGMSMMKWTPYAAFVEKLLLSPARYGEVPRYYVVTGKDALLDKTLYQEARISAINVTRSFYLESSDHYPMLSKPAILCNILSTIADL
ncbi:hypothetical protein R1sor_018153 [Riccia sorocarpa]|uniref:AB hydrolase-1 domain-containing protein n=1 Tax=Riccia sorocarpa TaxID=122646 RepID=A0ABD3I9A6_9MARC